MDYRAELNRSSLNRKPSQETLMSLLQLDPAPMDTASLYEKELPDLPEESMQSSTSTIRSRSTAASSSSTIGLSGTANGPLYYRMPLLCFQQFPCKIERLLWRWLT